MMFKVLMLLIPLLWINICLVKGGNPTWDFLIDVLISQSRDGKGMAHVDRACVIELDGGAPWTSNLHPNALKLRKSEGEDVAKVFRSKNSYYKRKGISIEGILYEHITEEDDNLVIGWKKGHGTVTLKATKRAIIIAHAPERSYKYYVTKAVVLIAGFLEGIGMSKME